MISSRCGTTPAPAPAPAGSSAASGRHLHADLAALGRDQAGERADQRGLAAAVGPDHGDELASAATRAAHAVERRARASRVADGEVARLEDHASGPPEQQGEERHADQRGDHADGQLQRAHDRARDHVGQHQERAADGEHQREQRAVQRPRDGADRVGNHQAHEADDAAGGDAGRGEQRGADVDQAPDALDVGAEMVGRLLAEREQVERRARSGR